MSKEFVIDFQGSATVYAESEDEAMDIFYEEGWDDFIIDYAHVDAIEEDECEDD